MICGVGRGTQQGKAQALPCYLYENAQAAAPTAPPAFTYGGSSYGLPFFLFYIIIRRREDGGRAETDDRRSYGLPFFLFYIIIRRREDGGRAETIAAAHLCGAHARHAGAYT